MLKPSKILLAILSALFVVLLAFGGFYLLKNIVGKENNYEKQEINNEPKLSVIVPVYNSEQYLKECLDSLIGQSYQNLEIICVNDGSPDNSIKILRDYEKEDSRIKVIDQANGGVSSARNVGIRAATGEYLTFVDSDDKVDLSAYKTCMNRIVNDKSIGKNIDVLAFDWIYFPDGNNDRVIPEKTYINNGFAALFESNKTKMLNFIWNKIYKTSLIKENNVWFKEGLKWAEDDLFNCIALPLAKNVTLISNKFYYYRANESGLSSQASDVEKKLKSAIIRANFLIDDWKARGFNQYDWLIEKVMSGTYDRIKEIKDPELKKFYSIQTLEIWENKIFPVVGFEKLSAEYQKNIKEIRSIIAGELS